MTTISITFVVCLSEKSLKSSTNTIKNKRASKTVTEEEESILDLQTVEETEFESTSKYVVYVEKPIKSLQIEYEIIPKLIYTVDVIFWGPIAKIITKDNIKSVSTISKIKNKWITFTIEHKISLDINELMLLKSHLINFTMRLDKSGATPTSVQDSSNFFFVNEDVDLNCIFIEAFEYIPYNDFENTSIAEEIVKLILRDLLHFAFKGEILNSMKLPGIHCRKKILKMINLFTANIEYKCFNTFEDEDNNITEILNAKPPTPTPKKKAEKKGDKEKARKMKGKLSVQETNTFQISIPGEVLFTDPNLTVFNFSKRTRDLKCGFVIINVDNLINSYQKSILNPVVVKLNKLMNVPVEMLNKERFEYLYLTYNLFDFNCTTRAKKIEKTIYFKHHRIFFFEKKYRQFAQQVQKDFLLVQVHGLRKRLVSNVPELFGTNPKDRFLSEPLRNKKTIAEYSRNIIEAYNETIFIAVACFKLNLLLSAFRSFTQTEFCLHPTRCPIQLTKTVEQANTVTMNSINIDSAKETIVYPLSEGMLLDSELCLTVQMELQKSINKLLDGIIEKKLFFNRIILITGHDELAKYILSNVYTHNSCWIYKDDIVPPNYLSNYESTTDMNNANIITGFSIDNGDIYIMYLEGNAKWIQNVLWQPISSEIFTCAKILYNSDHVYKDRVYTSLIPYGGVYNITLHSSLKAILESSKIFCKGYLPEPCRRAFEKIDMILKSKSTNEITIHMLPTKKELFSLDIEWGVPIHWPL